MTLFYAGSTGHGDLLCAFRLLVGSAMAASIVLGLAAIRRRDIAAHRAWMTRAYALALGAGTQAFTVGFGEALFGTGVAAHRPHDGRRLGHQPRRRRVVHPPPRRPPGASRARTRAALAGSR